MFAKREYHLQNLGRTHFTERKYIFVEFLSQRAAVKTSHQPRKVVSA